MTLSYCSCEPARGTPRHARTERRRSPYRTLERLEASFVVSGSSIGRLTADRTKIHLCKNTGILLCAYAINQLQSKR